MFERVDARDWLDPSGLTRLFVSVGFISDQGRDKAKPVQIGPRTPSGT